MLSSNKERRGVAASTRGIDLGNEIKFISWAERYSFPRRLGTHRDGIKLLNIYTPAP